MRNMVPVSAVMALPPDMPISALKNFSLKNSLANRASLGGSGGSSSPENRENISATFSLGIFTAGASMCMGLDFKSCTMNSPRSVS